MNTSTEKEMRIIARLPLMVMEKILKYVSSTKDRKNCRLVCFNWLYLIDTHVGLALKLTRANKAKLFASDLLRSCTSLKILESAGKLNWYVCFFSPKNLKSVEIVGNILDENWSLLLGQCASMQLLTIKTQTQVENPFFGPHRMLKDFTFPDSFATNKINHYSLERIVFSGIHAFRHQDVTSISNVLRSIGIAPRLRQMIFIFAYLLHIGITLPMETALHSLMLRNPGLNGVAFLCNTFRDSTPYSEMTTWDNLLRENRSCLVFQRHYSRLTDTFQRLLPMLDELYYEIFEPIHINVFRSIINYLLKNSRNLKTLSLEMSEYPQSELDCTVLLEGLEHLTKLSLFNGGNNLSRNGRHWRITLGPSLLNSNFFSANNIQLEYLYIETPVSETNLDDIFRIPRLKELHIQHQESQEALKKRHFDMAIEHNHLSLIYWAATYQEKWKRFSAESKNDTWIFVTLEEKTWVPQRRFTIGVTVIFQTIPVDRCVTLNTSLMDLDQFNRNHSPQNALAKIMIV